MADLGGGEVNGGAGVDATTFRGEDGGGEALVVVAVSWPPDGGWFRGGGTDGGTGVTLPLVWSAPTGDVRAGLGVCEITGVT